MPAVYEPEYQVLFTILYLCSVQLGTEQCCINTIWYNRRQESHKRHVVAAMVRPDCAATRDSIRAGRGRRGCQLHTAGHLSQSSVARLAARARQLCDPG